MKDTVLMTGSRGLIGSAAIRRLADGYCMVGFDRATGSHHPPPMGECVCIDLTQEDSLRSGTGARPVRVRRSRRVELLGDLVPATQA